jgi:hypothetical protein
MAESLRPAALGFRAHAGWAAAVCLAGDPASPVVVARERLLLTSGPLPWEPYHAAKHLDLERGEALVRKASEEAEAAAARRVDEIAATLAEHGCELRAAGIVLGTGRPDFSFRQGLATHAAMHNAEGWLFREALKRASEARSLPVIGALETAAYEQAAAATGTSSSRIEARVQELGRPCGPPWGKDQKLATAAAWLALARPA